MALKEAHSRRPILNLFFARRGSVLNNILTIAGFDPSSGAGVTADLAVFASFGLFGTSCITALTVQSTQGVRASYPVDAQILRESLDCLADDFPFAGIKIGMLATAGNAEVVSDFLERLRAGSRAPVILDPVLRSSSGAALLSGKGVATLRSRLLPLVDWVTPNQAELGVLLDRSVVSSEEVETAARSLQSLYPGLGVIATGGDQAAPNDFLLDPAGESVWLTGRRVESRATHGTGCAFSSALACGLATGQTGVEAAFEAKRFVEQAIASAPGLGHGKGPMNLHWPLKKLQDRLDSVKLPADMVRQES